MDNGAEQQENYYKYNRGEYKQSDVNKVFYERMFKSFKGSSFGGKLIFNIPDKLSFIQWLRLCK